MPPVSQSGPVRSMHVGGGSCSDPKVAIIDVDGVLLNMDMTGLYSLGENPVALFRERLEAAARDPSVRAIVLRINSPGGGVTASDIMWQDLHRFKARARVPVVACFMDVGAGGAYYLAMAADVVMAHPTTVVGGVGVILNLYNLQDAMAQFNVIGIPIKAGENIDIGTPIVPPTPEQQQLLQDMAGEFHARFQQIVAESRTRHDPARVEDLDGRVFTAQQALERGLIDRVGYLDDAVETARQMAGLARAQVVLLHRPDDRARTPYAITPNVPLQSGLFPISVPGFDRARLPTFLYLWQPEPTLEKMGGR